MKKIIIISIILLLALVVIVAKRAGQPETADQANGVSEINKVSAVPEPFPNLTVLSELADKSNQLFKEGKYQEVIQHYQQTLEMPEIKESPQSQASIKAAMARTYRKLKDFQAALSHIEEALKLFAKQDTKDYARALFVKSTILADLGDFDALLSFYQQMLDHYYTTSTPKEILVDINNHIETQRKHLKIVNNKIMQKQQQGDALALMEQWELKDSITRTLSQAEAAKQTIEENPQKIVPKIYQPTTSDPKVLSILLEVYYNHVRFLLWQGKNKEAAQLAYALDVDSSKASGTETSYWEKKILGLITDSPAK